MNSMEDRISRRIYIAIGLVLCFTAIVMYRIQNAYQAHTDLIPEDFVEGYGDEKPFESNNTSKETEIENIEQVMPVQTQVDDSNWNAILVNKKEYIDASYPVTLGTLSSGKQLDARVIDITEQMISDARLDGVSLIVCSAYRSYSYQQGLFDREVKSFKALGYSDVQSYDKASKEVAIPGTSEHQLGLAIDFITSGYTSLDQGFENTDAFKWLYENSYKYGWILRYNKGKEIYTGINYEPWHFRYVGTEIATAIKDTGLSYEEYLGRDYTF